MADKVDDLMIKTLNKVSETGNITTGDIFVLKYCKHDRAKQSQSPAYKQLLTGAGEVLAFLSFLQSAGCPDAVLLLRHQDDHH